MSIWSSVGADVVAADHGGPDRIDVDIATATSWNADVRLGLSGTEVDICAVLTVEMAEQLRANLDEAIRRVRAEA